LTDWLLSGYRQPSMSTFIAIGFVAVVGWLAALTYLVIAQGRELQVLLVSLKHIAGAEKHLGGAGSSHSRRRTDFRVPVNLAGFLRVLDHARPCRVVDLSRSGAQILPEGGGQLPVGSTGTLTIDFGEFDSATTHVRIVRAIDAAGTYGVQFVDAPVSFREKCHQTMRVKFRAQLNQT
jgi:hypothetical protein